MTLGKNSFVNINGKGENAAHQHVLLFPTIFLKIFSCGYYKWEVQGKELTHYPQYRILMHLSHYQTTNFRLFQTERVCRQQFQI